MDVRPTLITNSIQMFIECSRMYFYLILNDCKTLLLQREKTNNQCLVEFLFYSFLFLLDLQALVESTS